MIRVHQRRGHHEEPAPQDAAVADGACPVCGFVADAVDPAQASSLLRTIATGYRAVLTVARVAADVVDLRVVRPAGSWTPVQHAAHVRDVLHAGGNRLSRFFAQDHPVIADVDIEAPHAADGAWTPDVVLAVLAANAERLARLVDSMPTDRWAATGTRGTTMVTARQVMIDTVHECVHHLVLAERSG